MTPREQWLHLLLVLSTTGATRALLRFPLGEAPFVTRIVPAIFASAEGRTTNT